jgi:excisionase family DNA binding protein
MSTATLPAAPALLTPEEAAQFLGLQVQTLASWRSSGRHALKFLKIGRTVKYRRSDLENFLERCCRTST